MAFAILPRLILHCGVESCGMCDFLGVLEPRCYLFGEELKSKDSRTQLRSSACIQAQNDERKRQGRLADTVLRKVGVVHKIETFEDE